MKSKELVAQLKSLADNDRWLISRSQLRIMFPDDSEESLKKSLKRHVGSGYLERVAYGLYRNKLAEVSAHPLEDMVPFLRPTEFNYVTAETVLSEAGAISQIPQNYLAVMTTGTAGRHNTPFGLIEFSHTRKSQEKLSPDVFWDADRGIHVAKVRRAYSDLLYMRRNIDMVDKEDLEEALEEERERERGVHEPA